MKNMIGEGLLAILKNKDVKSQLGADVFSFIYAVCKCDPFLGIQTIDDAKKFVYQFPVINFWEKLRNCLMDVDLDVNARMKMASQLADMDYEKAIVFIREIMQDVDKLENDTKVYFYSSLLRCLLVQEMDKKLFYKLKSYISSLTIYELKYISDCEDSKAYDLTMDISTLYQQGLFEQSSGGQGTLYKLTSVGQALNDCCLNYDRGGCDFSKYKKYSNMSPVPIIEPATKDDIDDLFRDYK